MILVALAMFAEIPDISIGASVRRGWGDTGGVGGSEFLIVLLPILPNLLDFD